MMYTLGKEALELKAPGQYEIHINKDRFPGEVQIFVADSMEYLNTKQPLLSSNAEKVLVEVGISDRPYFKLVSESGAHLFLAERAIRFEGGVNFRDLGGYETSDNRAIRWGKLYRSGHLSNLTENDKVNFESLQIRAICDFRVDDERAKESAQLPGNPLFFESPIMPGLGHDRYFHDLFKSAADADEVIEAMHKLMINLVANADSNYLNLFEALSSVTGGSFLMNCSAGKERTGVGVALLMLALGVSKEDVKRDFLLSKLYFPYEKELDRIYEKYELDPENPKSKSLIEPLLVTRESYIDCVLDYILTNFGTFEHFLVEKLRLDGHSIEQLRDTYTIPISFSP